MESETGQTGQGRGKRAYVDIIKEDDLWTWVLYAKNGVPVAVAAKDWERRNDCVNSVRAVFKLFSDPERPRILITHEEEE